MARDLFLLHFLASSLSTVRVGSWSWGKGRAGQPEVPNTQALMALCGKKTPEKGKTIVLLGGRRMSSSVWGLGQHGQDNREC